MFAIFRNAKHHLICQKLGLPILYAPAAKLSQDCSFSDKITIQESCAVRDSWPGLPKAELASEFFDRLFLKFPDTVKLFNKYGKTHEELLTSPDFIDNHGVGNVLNNIGKVLPKLDYPCEVLIFCSSIGRMHQGICGLRGETIECSKRFMFEAIEKNYKCKMDCTSREGWRKALTMIFDGISKGLEEKN